MPGEPGMAWHGRENRTALTSGTSSPMVGLHQLPPKAELDSVPRIHNLIY